MLISGVEGLRETRSVSSLHSFFVVLTYDVGLAPGAVVSINISKTEPSNGTVLMILSSSQWDAWRRHRLQRLDSGSYSSYLISHWRHPFHDGLAVRHSIRATKPDRYVIGILNVHLAPLTFDSQIDYVNPGGQNLPLQMVGMPDTLWTSFVAFNGLVVAVFLCLTQMWSTSSTLLHALLVWCLSLKAAALGCQWKFFDVLASVGEAPVWRYALWKLTAKLHTIFEILLLLMTVLQCKKTLQDNRDFLLDSARMMLKARASNMPEDEMCAARKCFTVLWPPGDPETREARVGFSTECTTLAAPVPESEGDRASSQLLITVERANLFDSAVSQVDKASSEDLHRPLDVRFQGEAAEDAGGPRREFFNEFGIAAAANEQVWCTTPAGALKPTPGADAKIMRSCGRIFGLALCQVENAAQEQNVGANATLADLLAAVREPEEEQAQQQQKLLIGLPLSRSFLRVLQGDAPTSVEELQVELNAEQAESSPDFRGSANFLNTSLQDLGLAGQLTFSAAPRDGSVVDLVPDGRHTVVTDATKHEWLRQTLRYEMVDSIQEAAGAFRAGVSEAAGVAHLVLLSAVELRDEWSGRADVSDEDVKLWEARTKVNPTRKRQAAWFFELLSDELRSKRARILKLTTGSDRWPVDSRTFSFTIEPMDGGDDSLPRAMTCGNMLQLPSYECREKLRDNLLKACEWGVSMDLV